MYVYTVEEVIGFFTNVEVKVKIISKIKAECYGCDNIMFLISKQELDLKTLYSWFNLERASPFIGAIVNMNGKLRMLGINRYETELVKSLLGEELFSEWWSNHWFDDKSVEDTLRGLVEIDIELYERMNNYGSE